MLCAGGDIDSRREPSENEMTLVLTSFLRALGYSL